MANEVTLSASIEYDDGKVARAKSASNVVKSITGGTKRFVEYIKEIGTDEEALDTGELDAVGYFFIQNLDDTNYVEIRSATGADNDVLRLDPDANDDGKGGFAVGKWGSDVTAPCAIASTAPCRIYVLMIEA